MSDNLPSIIVTGASGFIGRYFLEAAKKHYKIYAIARRSRVEAGIPYHANIQWFQCDIGSWQCLQQTAQHIKEQGGAEFLLHLAAYYDFSYSDSPEYERTNVNGTENVLRLAKLIGVRRFIFASSVIASRFPAGGAVITEKSPADANFAYAHSKRRGEEMVREYSKWFPCSIVRFAAVFSDWCEYGPLYRFLSTWLSRRWDSRVLGGKGESAVPYIHIHDLNKLLMVIFSKNDSLPSLDIYVASPDGSTSHRELFETATLYYFGQSIKPIFIPKLLAYPGVAMRNVLGHLHLTHHKPFERLWMIRYVDLKMNVDSSYTRKALSCELTPRYHVLRRLLFLIEKIKAHPVEWRLRNEAALKVVARRPSLMIYENMIAEKEKLVGEIYDYIRSPENSARFSHYRRMDSDDLRCALAAVYHLLLAAVRSGDRNLMLDYVDDVALRRFAEGFEPVEVCSALSAFSDIVTRGLSSKRQLRTMRQEIYDYIGLTIQLAQDEVEDLYENLELRIPPDKIADSSLLPDCKQLQRMIKQLSAFHQVFPGERSDEENRKKNQIDLSE